MSDESVSIYGAQLPDPAGGSAASLHIGAAVTPVEALLGEDLYLRPVSGSYERFFKPMFDVVVAVVLSVLALPLIVVIAVALRVSMGSPVMFRQERVGRNGTIFTILKFRTMHPDRRKNRSTSYTGPERRLSHKTRNDPRITPLGRFLRKWSLDELPQVWNVVRGDMSLVGPRPELVEIVQRYKPWEHRRHAVKPGLTGLWQISGRSGGAMHEHVDIDLAYVDRVSFVVDLRILIRTIPAVLGKSVGF